MEPLGVSDVALLVGMVKTGGRSGSQWPAKARTILALATFTDGEWWGGPEVEAFTGIDAALARRILLDLERQKVLIRDGGHAAAPKVFWCQVNPDWRRWEVEWSADHRMIEQRIAAARARWRRAPLDRLGSRAAGARSHRVIAQLSARDYERQMAQNGPAIARPPRAIPDQDRARTARDRGTARRQEVSLLRSGAAAESSSSAPTPQEEEGKSHQRWGMVRAVFVRRADGAKGLWGTPERHLARLLAEHGPERLLEAIDQAPDGFGPKLLADHVEQALLLDPAELPPAPSELVPGVIPLSDAGREHLEQLVAVYRADGGEPPEELLSRLARWQDGVEVLEEA